METYVIVRRRAWRTRAAADAASARADVEAEHLSQILVHRSTHIVDETDGTVGFVCIYEAVGPEAIRRHSKAARLPVDEILKVADAIVGRPDPAAVAA
jgi:hypothetical protein